LPARGIGAQLAAPLGKSFGERRRRRDRVPRGDRRPAVDGAERGCRVAVDEDALADPVAPLDAKRQRAFEAIEHVCAAERQRPAVWLEKRVLAAVLLGEQALDLAGIDVEERRQRAEIDDVLEELSLARVGVLRVAQLGQRHAERGDVGAELRRRQRPRRIVEQVAAGVDLGDVLVPGLRVHRDGEVDAAAAPAPSRFGDANLVPRRQALDVGRKDVARGDRNAHAQDRACEEAVCGSRARSVDVGELDDEVVDACVHGDQSAAMAPASAAAGTDLGGCRRSAACAASIRNFCMSHAPVGQRSAHSPQCRHTSSSLTITRPVLSRADT
jgi:hypothetical protein